LQSYEFMKLSINGWPLALLVASLLGVTPAARAYPPAADGIIYGEVKDQYGTPLLNPANQVVLQTPGGVQVVTPIQPGLAIGVNYRLYVPMDTGDQPPPYVPNALTNATPYKLYVTQGTATNLPIEMSSPSYYARLGAPSTATVQNLTLGADANGDGIPDQWEQIFLSEIGTNLTLVQINPNTDYTGDGRTLKQEYLLGNYPFNPTDDFSVQLVSQSAGSAVLAFTSMVGRTYTAFGSPDLQNWTPLAFTIPALNNAAATVPGVYTNYYSSGIQPMQIQTLQPANAPTIQFFRLSLQ